MLDRLLEWLDEQGARNIVLALAWPNGGREIYEHVQELTQARLGKAVCDIHLEEDVNGTAGAIRKVLKTGLDIVKAPLIVLNGDTLIRNIDLAKVLDFHKSYNPVITTVVATDNPMRRNTNDIPVLRVLGESALRLFAHSDEPSLETLLPMDAGMRYPIPMTDFVDIGTWEGFARAQTWVIE